MTRHRERVGLAPTAVAPVALVPHADHSLVVHGAEQGASDGVRVVRGQPMVASAGVAETGITMAGGAVDSEAMTGGADGDPRVMAETGGGPQTIAAEDATGDGGARRETHVGASGRIAGNAGGIDRRAFLRASLTAAGGLMLAVQLPRRAAAAEPAPAPPSPMLYITIEPDGRITLAVPKTEIGQGVRTSLALLIAEELEADWSQIRVETASYDPRRLDQGTGGSSSVLSAFTPLRQAGAAMRMMLTAAAAARWKVPVAQLVTENGYIVDGRRNRRASYGELAGDAARQAMPANPPLKPRAQWKLLGKEHVGKDCADIVHGRARYGLDQRLPGMLFASIERPREIGAVVEHVDTDAALAVPGVQRVVTIAPSGVPVAAAANAPPAPSASAGTPPSAAASVSTAPPEGRIAGGVAVVATSTWAALEGRKKLAIRWKSGPHAGESTAQYRREMAAALDRPGAEQVNRIGDPEAALASAKTVIRAEYEVPFLAHATMEPMNCTAHWANGRLTLWAPTQDPETAVQAVAARLGIALGQVTLHIPLIGGGFGRRLNVDYAVEAAAVARELAVPVQVMWTREDDLGHDFYRPCARHRLEACLDERGAPLALRHRLCDAAIGATYRGDEAGKFGGSETECVSNAFYRVPHRTSEYTLLRSGVPRGWWRAVHSTHGVFALESFVDELAEAAGADPLAYRLALIDHPPPGRRRPSSPETTFVPERMRACLALAAEKAGWGRALPAGHGMGLACGGFDHMSYAAVVIEASVHDGRVAVHRAVCAADCGTVIHPDGARAQVEGAITQGLSAALCERMTFDAGRAVETNFDRYRLLRIHEAPAAIEVHFVERSDVPVTGLGEPALPPVAPALANALYRATGHRLRDLPLAIPR